MLSFSDCHTIIENHLKQIDFAGKEPAKLYQPISYILSLGGKRIRPVSALLACNLFTEDVTPAIKPAIAIEIFHNFTLVHDDIMDNAALRRNKQTVHAKWNQNIAILSGDAMQIVAYQILCDTDAKLLKPLLDIFNNTAIEVCEGQQFDMDFSMDDHVSLEDYIRMIELKTSVLLATSLKVGALCGDAPLEEANKLYEFGRSLGLAFQIKDDYLDVYANQDLFGKTVGGDIAENKKTFLLIKALELAKGQHADILQRALKNEYADITEKVEIVRKVYNELSIPQITCDTIAQFSDRAFCWLDSLTIPDEKKMNLREMARELMEREK